MGNTNAFAPTAYQTIVFIDVVGFGSSSRTDSDRTVIHTALFQSAQDAFTRAGVRWRGCYREDRGDGLLVIIPPEVPISLVTEELPAALAMVLNQHNRTSSPSTRFQLRLAVHDGEVTRRTYGVSGEPIIHAARLLNASEFKQVMTGSSASLAMIASDQLYNAVIRHLPDSASGRYRPMKVSVRPSGTIAWVRLLGIPSSSSVVGADHGETEQRSESGRKFDVRDFDSFYLANFPFVRNVIHARAQDWDLAESVATEAMMIAYRKWHEVVEHPNPVGFVVLTARRILLRVHKKQAKSMLFPLETPDSSLGVSGVDPADIVTNRLALEQALRFLPRDQRECFVLYEILDQSIRDIATLMNIPEGTVKTRLRAARQTLRELLRDDFGEGDPR